MSKSADDILALIESENAIQRKVGILYIMRENREDFLGDILKLLFDADHQVRERAALTLDQLRNPITIPALVDALYDVEHGVRSNAAWALVHLGEQVVPYVTDVLRDDVESARRMAFQVLIRIETDEALDAIRRYWHWEE